MTVNRRKNIAVIISTIFLFLALINGWPYGFFTLLRLIVFATSAYIAWATYIGQKEKWTWIFGFLAVLFNPFVVIHFTRELWSFIDISVGVFMIFSVFMLKLAQKARENK